MKFLIHQFCQANKMSFVSFSLVRLSEDLKEDMEDEDEGLQLYHFVVKAAALACHRVPAANSSWMGDKIRQ